MLTPSHEWRLTHTGCGLGGVGNLVHELHMSKATCMSRGYDHETV